MIANLLSVLLVSANLSQYTSGTDLCWSVRLNVLKCGYTSVTLAVQRSLLYDWLSQSQQIVIVKPNNAVK